MEQKKLSDEQLNLLKKPLPPESIKPHPTKSFLSTIKVIYIVERLNEVFGLGGWYVNNEVVESNTKMIVVKSTFHAPAYGITIPDIFGGNDNADRGDAYKGACTDALSKIASYMYIGMDVYKGLEEHGEQKTPKQVKQDNQFARDNFQETRKPDPDFHDGEQTKLITIADVLIEKKTSKQGKEYQKYTVIDTGGEKYETIDRKLGAWCDTKTGFPVEITYEYNAQFKQNNLKAVLDVNEEIFPPPSKLQ